MPPASSSAASSGSTIRAARVSPTARSSAASRARRPDASLLRRLDAVLADRDALGHELAVAFDPCAAEDGLAGLEIGSRAGDERHHFSLRRDQDLLLTVLVLERDLVAAARLRGTRDIGVGHQ